MELDTSKHVNKQQIAYLGFVAPAAVGLAQVFRPGAFKCLLECLCLGPGIFSMLLLMV